MIVSHVDEIRTRLRSRLFEQFSVVTNDGADIPIWNPEFCILSPDGRTLHAYQKNFDYNLIFVRNITRIQSGPRFDPGDEPRPSA
jgi:hypothetical protein